MDNVLVDFPSGVSKLSQEVINEYESNLDKAPTKDWYLHIIKISIMEIIWLMIEKNGADAFKGELIHFGTKKFPDWKSVCSYLVD